MGAREVARVWLARAERLAERGRRAHAGLGRRRRRVRLRRAPRTAGGVSARRRRAEMCSPSQHIGAGTDGGTARRLVARGVRAPHARRASHAPASDRRRRSSSPATPGARGEQATTCEQRLLRRLLPRRCRRLRARAGTRLLLLVGTRARTAAAQAEAAQRGLAHLPCAGGTHPGQATTVRAPPRSSVDAPHLRTSGQLLGERRALRCPEERSARGARRGGAAVLRNTLPCGGRARNARSQKA